MKQPILITPNLTNMEGTESGRKYLGKKVYTDSGDRAGRVRDVIIKNNAVAGLIVKGREKLFIDASYYIAGAADNVLLKIDPVTMLKKKLVFDNNGKKLGRVKSIERKSLRNACDELVVKKNILSKSMRIPFTDVEVSKKNIILNKSY